MRSKDTSHLRISYLHQFSGPRQANRPFSPSLSRSLANRPQPTNPLGTYLHPRTNCRPPQCPPPARRDNAVRAATQRMRIGTIAPLPDTRGSGETSSMRAESAVTIRVCALFLQLRGNADARRVCWGARSDPDKVVRVFGLAPGTLEIRRPD